MLGKAVKKIWPAEQRKRENLLLFVLLTAAVLPLFAPFLRGLGFLLYDDVGGDTMTQYFPLYRKLAADIRSGSLTLYNFSLGSGAAWINEQSILMDPFAWITLLFGILGGDAAVKYGLTVMTVVKLYAAGFLCLRYLRRFPVRSCGRAAAAWLFSFSGYMLLWGQHFFLGTAPVFLLLVLTAAEEVLQKGGAREHLRLGLACGATMLFSTYLGYMILLFSAGYFLLRLAFVTADAPKGSYLKRLSAAFLTVLPGALIGAVLFLPSAEAILATSRVSGEAAASPSLFYGARTYLALFSRMSSNSLMGNAGWPSEIQPDNYYEMPQLYYSSYLFLLLGQWVSMKLVHENNGKTRRLRLLCAGLAAAAVLLPFGAMLFNAFSAETFRFTFLLMPLFALMAAQVWDGLFAEKKGSTAMLAVGTLLGLASVFLSAHYLQERLRPLALTAARLQVIPLLFVCFLKLLRLGKSRTAEKGSRFMELAAPVCLSLALLYGVLMEGEVCIRWRNYIGAERMAQIEAAERETSAVIRSLRQEDTTAFRTEKLYMDFYYADSMLEDYMPSGGYNSVITGGMRTLYEKYWPAARISEKLQLFQESPERDISSLLGVKYVLAREPYEADWLRLLRQEGGIYIYENTSDPAMAAVYAGEPDIAAARESFPQLTLRGTELSGTVRTEGGALVLALPYEPAWKLYVNGSRVETEPVLYGLVGAQSRLSAGTYEIVLRYENPLYAVGAGISLASLAVLILWTRSMKKRKSGADAKEV